MHDEKLNPYKHHDSAMLMRHCAVMVLIARTSRVLQRDALVKRYTYLYIRTRGPMAPYVGSRFAIFNCNCCRAARSGALVLLQASHASLTP